MADHEGRKDDQEKCRLDLIPPEVFEALGWVLTDGAKQYGERNCEQGMRYGRLYAAFLRHMLAWWQGEDADPDSGRSHLWHALFCVSLLVVYEQRDIGDDDRPAIDSRTIPEKVKEFVEQMRGKTEVDNETDDLRAVVRRYFTFKADWDCQPTMPMKSQRAKAEAARVKYQAAKDDLREAVGLEAETEDEDEAYVQQLKCRVEELERELGLKDDESAHEEMS